jgi:hypothetical protein
MFQAFAKMISNRLGIVGGVFWFISMASPWLLMWIGDELFSSIHIVVGTVRCGLYDLPSIL